MLQPGGKNRSAVDIFTSSGGWVDLWETVDQSRPGHGAVDISTSSGGWVDIWETVDQSRPGHGAVDPFNQHNYLRSMQLSTHSP